jgi:hypothetical protein
MLVMSVSRTQVNTHDSEPIDEVTDGSLFGKQDTHIGNPLKRHPFCMHIQPEFRFDVISPIYGYERSKNT